MTELGPSATKSTDVDLKTALKALGDVGYFNSGLMPTDGSGVVSVRRALGYTQVAYQMAPGAYFTIWGEHEGATNAGKYVLAHPYRLYVIDFNGNQFMGARHFLATAPINSLDQQLYHVNLPNTNCRGYSRGVTVGWTCLYGHDIPEKLENFGQWIHWAVLRMSGDEAYNDANMSDTDGPRTYQAWLKNDSKKSYLWNPIAWAKKTEVEGWEWTLDESLWMPIKVAGKDAQTMHDDSGVPFTVEFAMYGNYSAQYNDSPIPRPFNVIDRDDLGDLDANIVLGTVTTAIAAAAAGDVTKKPIATCYASGEPIYKGDSFWNALDSKANNVKILREHAESIGWVAEASTGYYMHRDNLYHDEISEKWYLVTNLSGSPTNVAKRCNKCRKNGSTYSVRYGSRKTWCADCFRKSEAEKMAKKQATTTTVENQAASASTDF